MLNSILIDNCYSHIFQEYLWFLWKFIRISWRYGKKTPNMHKFPHFRSTCLHYSTTKIRSKSIKFTRIIGWLLCNMNVSYWLPYGYHITELMTKTPEKSPKYVQNGKKFNESKKTSVHRLVLNSILIVNCYPHIYQEYLRARLQGRSDAKGSTSFINAPPRQCSLSSAVLQVD